MVFQEPYQYDIGKVQRQEPYRYRIVRFRACRGAGQSTRPSLNIPARPKPPMSVLGWRASPPAPPRGAGSSARPSEA
ncbi:hypothetical protein PGT21_018999 [Puccinia graminis f. sp. tritici]|uniref:Uncharacterized protein n=1 Tax=Puccinia graminis f. sp. tritici TaxID=56615 RepID=A0A5B0PP71_PUCGR|nr:hypothetical protein PGT21_018999 [Puccinia graminis f. sp. tritici]